MINLLIAVLAAAALLGGSGAMAQQAGRGGAASAAEVAALRQQLEALQARIAELEARQQAQAAEVAAAREAVEAQNQINTDVQNALDLTSDNIAKTAANVGEWVGRFQWKGDLRYRNESFDIEYVPRDRWRDRIRARAGFVARVNDTLRTEIQFATGGADPRSSNQTLTDQNSRKALDLDLAYAEWQATPSVKLTLGKMKFPWVRPGQSLFFDTDVNPEGIAVNYQGVVPGGFFASAFYTHLAERSAAADSNMIGAQIGWRSVPTAPTRWTIGASYFDHGAVEGYNPLFGGSANGNTTTTSGGICRRGISPCLRYDFNVAELFAEVATTLGNYPFTAYLDYARNDAADLDTAYGIGFQYGRASNPRTWEFGALYQKVEKDALFAQTIDSDFADGNTDADGLVLRFGYAFARNFRFNATYFINQTNIDVPVNITGVGPVSDRDYRRLQLDFNMSF
ncbi:MAG: putative porin [Steroidobacteraceae bacterium]|nr:putative porin [Steroidobacteraceae bacterium]MDW8258527.1 putative porin [Gammaproteobacteria bacterium]